MSQLDYLSVGMGGPTILMSEGDIANNIRGYALQALEDCVFSQIDLDMTPVCGFEKKLQITAVTNGSEEFTLSADDIATLKVAQDQQNLKINLFILYKILILQVMKLN